MASAEVDIKRWGSGLGVRLPAAVAKAAKLRAGQRVRVSVKGRRVVLAPIDASLLSLAQRLALFDPTRHGGETMAVHPRGAERR
jgi:antitoxin MazE